MITLYHGSNVPIKRIDLSMSKPDKDFGQGFYLTDIMEQAFDMAKRRYRVLEEGEPIVTAFAFDETLLERNILNVKKFDDPSNEWAELMVGAVCKEYNNYIYL